MPGCEIPPGQNCERVKGARLPAQPPGVARELIPPPLRGAILWRSREVGGFAGVRCAAGRGEWKENSE